MPVEISRLNLDPLVGKRILVTRPAALAAGLAERLREHGAIPVVQPVIDIVPPADPVACTAALARWDDCDYVVFVSPSAVTMAGQRLAQGQTSGRGPRFAAVGRGTALAAERHGARAVICPDTGFDSEHLLERPEFAQLRGKRLLLVRGEGGRTLLAETLAARGAEVIHAVCYRRQPAALDTGLLAGPLDAVTATSREIVEALLHHPAGNALRALPWFVGHARVAAVAREQGLGSVHPATDPGDAGILATLERYFAGQSTTSRRT